MDEAVRSSTGNPGGTTNSAHGSAEGPSGAVNPGFTAKELVGRMRQGDRQAAAEFFNRYRSRIRRRIHGKLKPRMRRLFDSQDIMSTVGRRLDLYVRDGKLQAVSEEQLWSLMIKMADHALIDKARLWDRLSEMEGANSKFAQSVSQRIREEAREDSGPEFEVETAIGLLDDKVDQQILVLMLRDMQQARIAQAVNLAPTAVRKRWQRIRTTLRDRLAPEGTGSPS